MEHSTDETFEHSSSKYQNRKIRTKSARLHTFEFGIIASKQRPRLAE
jgi:hypothetical protein